MDDDFLKEFRPRGDWADSGEAAEGLPQPDGEYRAHARISSEPVYTLHCLLGAAGCRSYQYVHLDSDTSLVADRQGQVIRLQFLGRRSMAVTIRGRNLRELYDAIHRHRMPWISELESGRDFVEDGKAVITSIDIAEVMEEGQKRQEFGPAKVLEIG